MLVSIIKLTFIVGFQRIAGKKLSIFATNELGVFQLIKLHV